MKRCTRCEAHKPLEAFSKARKSPDGFHWWCKECFAAYYRASRERTLARNKAWRDANPDYFRHKHLARRDERLRAMLKYRTEHRADLRQQAREYQKRNLAKFRTYSRAYTARKAGAPVVEHVDRARVLEIAGGRCGICSKPVDPLDFHVDHIVPLSGGGDHTYANTQPTHPVCNLRKGAKLDAASSRDVAA